MSSQDTTSMDMQSLMLQDEVIKSAAHALALDFKFTHQRLPVDQDVANWIHSFWEDRDRITAMIADRNPWVLKLSSHHPSFWASLEKHFWPQGR